MIRKLAVTAIALCVPAVAEAQQPSQCEAIPRDASTAFLTVQLPSGNRNVFVGGGVTFRCPDRGITLVADSLESYGDEQRVFMIGNVRYSEPRLAVTTSSTSAVTPSSVRWEATSSGGRAALLVMKAIRIPAARVARRWSAAPGTASAPT